MCILNTDNKNVFPGSKKFDFCKKILSNNETGRILIPEFFSSYMNPFLLKINQSMQSMDLKTQNLHQKHAKKWWPFKFFSLSDYHSHLILAQWG